MTNKDFERFAAKVAPPDTESGCQMWLASKKPKGYGQFGIAGGMKPAHRLSYEHYYGPIPAGLCVLHKCVNRACVSPDHLFLGTNQDAVILRTAKGRHIASRGELNGAAKLNEANVRTIKAMSQKGQTHRAIALEMGVAHSQIYRILRGKSWQHII